MKQIEVQILQQSYLLSCREGQESRLLEAVERVDTAMTRIRDGGKVRSRERIAVLAALNLAFDIADREASDRATPPPPVTTAPRTSDPAGLPPDASADAQRLQALVRRLDEALGDDGRLL
jgi:cell division protein ZapA